MAHAREFDEIGYWSEIKLDIVRDYAAVYSKILSAQTKPKFCHVYIDGFSGSGVHVSKRSGKYVAGSPLNALLVQPPFCEYYFVDLDSEKAEHLRREVGERKDVFVIQGDCNDVLPTQVFPRVLYEHYRRGLCLLDPYGLHLDWHVVETAGRMRSIDLILNFPVMDMNRNALWRDPAAVSPGRAARMTVLWGDDSWRQQAYRASRQRGLFGDTEEKVDNADVAEAFRQRLESAAGFAHVPSPMPMRNSRGAIVYYLFFASQKRDAGRIAAAIFSKYAKRGA
jgi:three-Cys-motif partner protein